jgi:YVTN family beta-propeller protein
MKGGEYLMLHKQFVYQLIPQKRGVRLTVFEVATMMFILSFLFFGNMPSVSAAETSYHLIKKVTIGGDGGWDCLRIDASARRFYIPRGTHVMVFDLDKSTTIGDITDTPGVHDVAIASDFNRGYTSNGGDNTVTVFDLKTLKALNRLAVGSRPDVMLYDPATKCVFTFNGGSSDATVIDVSKDTVIGTIALGGRPEFAVSDEKGLIFVNIEDKNEIVAFDAKKLTVKNRWPLAPGDGPTGLAIDLKTHRLFAACANNKMIILDSLTGKVVATPDIGKGPDGAGFDPGTNLAFSPNGRDGTLTVIKEEAPNQFKVVETVATDTGARTMAVDTKNHQIYSVTAKLMPPPPAPPTSDTTARPRFRRSYEPGSFTILVVGTE